MKENDACGICEVRNMKDELVTIRTLSIASFAIIVSVLFPLIGVLFVVIDMKLEPLKENIKRNELRATRLESSIIDSAKDLSRISEGIVSINNNLSSLQYIYVSKVEAKDFITRDEVDGRLIKNK